MSSVTLLTGNSGPRAARNGAGSLTGPSAEGCSSSACEGEFARGVAARIGRKTLICSAFHRVPPWPATGSRALAPPEPPLGGYGNDQKGDGQSSRGGHNPTH